MNTQGKLRCIDRMKGLGILLMIAGHLYTFCYDETSTTANQMIRWTNMPMFLFLSGCVISPPPHWNKAVRRAARYLLPAILIGFLLNAVMSGKTLEQLISPSSLRMFQPPTGYWYLVVLTIFNFSLMPLLLFKKNILAESLLGALCYALFTVGWRYGGDAGQLFFMEHCATYYPFFFLGFMARRYDAFSYVLSHNWTFTLAVAVYAVAFNLHPDIHLVKNLIERFVLPVAGTVALVYLFGRREQQESRVENALLFFGRNSLNIYLIHFFLIRYIHLETSVAWLTGTDNTFIELFMTAALSILVAAASVYIGRFFMQSRLVRLYVYGEFANKKS